MKRLRKFARLSGIEQKLLVKAVLSLGAIRLGLLLLPLEFLRRFLIWFTRIPTPVESTGRSSSREDVVWAVETAGHGVPSVATCFTKALAAQMLLARRGHSTQLVIGVAKEKGEGFSAHAWLKEDDRVLVGDHRLERYATLTKMEM